MSTHELAGMSEEPYIPVAFDYRPHDIFHYQNLVVDKNWINSNIKVGESLDFSSNYDKSDSDLEKIHVSRPDGTHFEILFENDQILTPSTNIHNEVPRVCKLNGDSALLKNYWISADPDNFRLYENHGDSFVGISTGQADSDSNHWNELIYEKFGNDAKVPTILLNMYPEGFRINGHDSYTSFVLPTESNPNYGSKGNVMTGDLNNGYEKYIPQDWANTQKSITGRYPSMYDLISSQAGRRELDSLLNEFPSQIKKELLLDPTNDLNMVVNTPELLNSIKVEYK